MIEKLDGQSRNRTARLSTPAPAAAPTLDNTSLAGSADELDPTDQWLPIADDVGVSSTADEESRDDQASAWNLQLWMRSFTGWLVSLVIHLALILILAFLTFAVDHRRTMSLLLGEASSPDVVNFDVVIDGGTDADLEMDLQEPQTLPLVDDTMAQPLFSDAALATAPESLDDYETISQSGIDQRLASSQESGSGDGAQFFGVKGYGTRFVFIIDCSGSMDEYRRWKRAVRELKRSINELLDSQQFVVLLYSFQTTAMHNQPAQLVVASPDNQRSAIKWLQRQKPSGATFVADALQRAFELKPDAIFLLSDGDFDDLPMVNMVLQHYNGRAQLQGALNGTAFSERHHQAIPVHTISLGGASGTRTMRRIADENHGVFKLIED